MNCIDEGPVLQLLICFPEVFQSLAVEELDLAHCAPRSDKARDIVDNLPPGQFSRTQGLLSPLAIIDVQIGSVPLNDIARLVSQRVRTKQEPPTCTVETANASFGLAGFTGSHDPLPRGGQTV